MNEISSSIEVSVPASVRPRRWRRYASVAGLFLAAAVAASAGWAAWQEDLARQALAAGQVEQASQHVNNALWLLRRSESAHLLAARIARLRGEFPEAERQLSRCGELGGMSAPVQLEWLLLRCERGDVDDLAPEFWGLVKTGHDEAAAVLEAMASVYMRQTRYLEALKCLDSWVELAPDSIRARDWRGWVYNQLDHRAQAAADYEHLLRLRPDRSDIRLRLAEILVDTSQPVKAMPQLESLRQQRPNDADVMVAMARCWALQGQTDKARALLASVLEAHPHHFGALLHLGKLELAEHHAADAERWLRRAMKESPRDPSARFLLSRSLQMQGNRQEEARAEMAHWEEERTARDRLTRLMRTDLAANPNDPKLAREAGELFLRMGDEAHGLFWLRRALLFNPRDAQCRRALIAYYQRTNHPAKAEEQRKLLAAIEGQP